MHLGTVWNNCVLINYQGECGGYPRHLEEKIRAEWEKYTQIYPRSKHYNCWYDLETEICFSGAQFKDGPAGKDDHFIDDKDLFLDSKWGRDFVNETIKDNEVFTDQEVIYDDECIYSKSASFDRFKGKSVLIICAGPSTNAVKWQNVDYDYMWTCNKFYLNTQISEHNVDLVVLARDVALSNNHQFESYLQKHRTRIVFQLDRGSGIDAWKEARAFSEKHPERCFFFHTRYQSRIGIGARLLCFAVLMGLKDIYVVGLDGMTKAGPLHAFEPHKDNPLWYKKYGDVLQKRQFVVLWDYLLSLKKIYDFDLYNLGEGHPDNVSSNISAQECPLSEHIKRKITLENNDETVCWSTVSTLENTSTDAKEGVPTLVAALQDKNETVQRSTAYALANIGPAATEAVPALIAALQDEHKMVRRFAAYALGHIEPNAKDVVPALLAALKDRDETVQWCAATALEKIVADIHETVPALSRHVE